MRLFCAGINILLASLEMNILMDMNYTYERTMTATVQIHLTDGLSIDESGALVDESTERGVPVDTVVLEALREKAHRILKRRTQAASNGGVRPSLLNGMR
jgi:hypothetical protein